MVNSAPVIAASEREVLTDRLSVVFLAAERPGRLATAITFLFKLLLFSQRLTADLLEMGTR